MNSPETLSRSDLVEIIHFAARMPVVPIEELHNEIGIDLCDGESLTENAVCRKVYSIWYDEANHMLTVMSNDNVIGFFTSNPNSDTYIKPIGEDIAVQLHAREGVMRAARRDVKLAPCWSVDERIG